MNYLIINYNSQNGDYLFILPLTHVNVHTVVVKELTLPYSISLNDFLNNKWVLFILHEILEVRLFYFVLV